MISRRSLLTSSILGGAALATAGWAGYDLVTGSSTGALVTERLDVPIKGLAGAFDGYRIGFLTDLHLGMWIPDHWITNALEVLVAERVDLALFGGDYLLVDDNPFWQKAGLVRNREFAKKKTPATIEGIYTRVTELLAPFSFKDGMWAVPGNHDHWNDFSLFEGIFRKSSAVELLVNREVTVRRDGAELTVYGVDDFLTGIPAILPSRSGFAPRAPRILVSHNPDYVSWLLDNGQGDFDLALCGHTHGGQIRLPGFGALVGQIVDTRFISGIVQTSGTNVYTSRGIGVVGLPFRFNCPPEVTVVRLVTA